MDMASHRSTVARISFSEHVEDAQQIKASWELMASPRARDSDSALYSEAGANIGMLPRLVPPKFVESKVDLNGQDLREV